MGGMISSPWRRSRAAPRLPREDDHLFSQTLHRPPQRPRATPAPPPPLEDDDLLSEILIRLPPHPAGLLRASLVCKRWRRLLRDPVFLRLSRAFHRTPPVLGLYRVSLRGVSFAPFGAAPDRVPAERFVLRDPDWMFLGCGNGRVLLRSMPGWLQLLVWDPITGHRHCIRLGRLPSHVRACSTAVLGDPGCLGRRKGSSFRVAFVFTGLGRASACVYSSETGAWGRLITAEAPCDDVRLKTGTLVGDAFYWLLEEGGILELHLGKESLTAVEPPPGSQNFYEGNMQLMEAEGSALGFAGVKDYSLHLWEWVAEQDGTAMWVLSKIIDLDESTMLSGLTLPIMMVPPMQILGVDEGGNFAFVRMVFGNFMINLSNGRGMWVSDAKVMEFVRPYSSFYVAGGVGGGDAGWEQ
ncbi:hypothetical protein EJB05_23008, partial [Eragrostis curvula]